MSRNEPDAEEGVLNGAERGPVPVGPGPALGPGELDWLIERLASLEARIEGLEDQVVDLQGPGRDGALLEAILARLLPADAIAHLKTARREDLLALRSILDAWIDRPEGRARSEEPARPGRRGRPPRRRESINLD